MLSVREIINASLRLRGTDPASAVSYIEGHLERFRSTGDMPAIYRLAMHAGVVAGQEVSPERGLAFFEEAIGAMPEEAAAYAFAATVHQALGQYKEGALRLREGIALETDTEHAEAMRAQLAKLSKR